MRETYLAKVREIDKLTREYTNKRLDLLELQETLLRLVRELRDLGDDTPLSEMESVLITRIFNRLESLDEVLSQTPNRSRRA